MEVESGGTHPRSTKVVWRPRNSFVLGVVCGRSDTPIVLMAWTILVLMAFGFCHEVAPYYSHHHNAILDSPFTITGYVKTHLVVIVGILLFLATAIFFLLSSFVDPGVIPSVRILEELSYAFPGYAARVDATLMEDRQRRDDIYFRSAPLPAFNQGKECETCGIGRPPLSTHCSTCDWCVRGWDHHCNWIGNCVGQRNHRYFFFMVFFSFVSTIYVCILSTIYLFNQKVGEPHWARYLGSVLVALGSAAMGVFTGSTFVFNLDMIANAQTFKMRAREGVRRSVSYYEGLQNLIEFILYYSPNPSLFSSAERSYIQSYIKHVPDSYAANPGGYGTFDG